MARDERALTATRHDSGQGLCDQRCGGEPVQGPWYDAGMAETGKRLVFKRVVLGVVFLVSLGCLYVTAYLAAAWYEGARLGGNPVIRNVVIFQPLREYARSRAPGSLEFVTAESYCVNNGEFSLTQMHKLVKRAREEGRRY